MKHVPKSIYGNIMSGYTFSVNGSEVTTNKVPNKEAG